jgi:hypothetical protein
VLNRLKKENNVIGKISIRKFLEKFERSEKNLSKEAEDISLEAQLAEFLTIPPSEQNAFDLFPTSWSTVFDDIKTQGHFPGTKDPRINWLLEHVNLAGKSVLELGPLEAGHTLCSRSREQRCLL